MRGLARSASRGSPGFAMVEWIVAIAIVATALSASVVGVATMARTTLLSDRAVTADIVAMSQMESIKGQPYLPPPAAYPAIGTPSGYSVTVQAISVPGADDNIALIRVTVFQGGQAAETVEAYKVNR